MLAHSIAPCSLSQYHLKQALGHFTTLLARFHLLDADEVQFNAFTVHVVILLLGAVEPAGVSGVIHPRW